MDFKDINTVVGIIVFCVKTVQTSVVQQFSRLEQSDFIIGDIAREVVVLSHTHCSIV